ncbi:MAG: hydrogenase maturation protease [Anaerolineaceae bacterium]|nr:hydrogenase maturation protease [Anaerolineaceae bacterium]
MKSEKWVVGIGNPLRGDDGAGWAVVEALAELTVGPMQTVCVHQLLPELLDTIHTAERVIFVDASVDGEPGSVMVTSIQPTPDGPASSHQLHPAVLLAMGGELYGRMPPATLITITGQDFGYQEQLSPPVQQAVAAAVCQIEKMMQAKEPVL